MRFIQLSKCEETFKAIELERQNSIYMQSEVMPSIQDIILFHEIAFQIITGSKRLCTYHTGRVCQMRITSVINCSLKGHVKGLYFVSFKKHL
jgi:hypothetical protein